VGGKPLRTWTPLLLLLTLVAAPGGAARAELAPSRTTAEELTAALQPRRLALVIGIDHYDDPVFGDLRHAGDDAEAVADQLAAAAGGGFDHVIRLTAADETTRARVLQEVKVLATSARREDVVVLYFSGHGTLVVDDDGVGAPFLLVRDSRSRELATTALDLGALKRFFTSIPTQRKALIIDACFNGEGKSSLGAEAAEVAATLPLDQPLTDMAGLGAGEALLFATTLGRPAREDDELGHGTYTHYLLEAMTWEAAAADLDGDAVITAYEAHDWARQRVMERTGGVQLPEAVFRVVGVQDVVLSGDPAQRRERDRALVFAYLPPSHPYHGATLRVDGRDKGVFPGTLPAEAGRHHFVVVDPAGQTLFEGSATVSKGQALGVDDLRALVREDRRQLAVRGGYLGGSPDAWGPVWGPGMATVEVWSALRRTEPRGRGLYVGATLGLGFAPQREHGGGLVRDTRGAFWLAPEAGWGRDVRRLRLRVAMQARATVLPMDAVGPGSAAGSGLAAEAGWFFLSFGPVARVGIVVDDRVAVVLGGDLQLVYLDVPGGGSPSWLPFGGPTLGVEIGI